MYVDALLQGLTLPKKYYDSNFDISQKYSDEADIFIEQMKKIDGAEFSNKSEVDAIKQRFKELIKSAEVSKKRILNVFSYYEEANPKLAQEEFDALMEANRKYLFVASIDDWVEINTKKGTEWTQFRLNGERQFYRVRGVSDKSDVIQNNPDELFHIPLSQKALVNNERFSLAGFPSLYLSSMLLLAWQECGYPQKYYYSEYQYIKLADLDKRKLEDEMKFLALYSPYEIYSRGKAEKHRDFYRWLGIIYRYLIQYPLVLACSFVNHNGKSSYKQEYIIPQMLMQWVKRNDTFVQGISYFTCVDTSMLPNEYCAYNVVIPVSPPYDEKQYSIKLRENFTWTEPQYFEVPLLNPNANEKDRRVLYNFINRIQMIYKYYVPDSFSRYITEIEKTCICLYQLMQNGNGYDMQMIIHTLNLIYTCYEQICRQSIDEIIKSSENDKFGLADEEYMCMVEKVTEISCEFRNTDKDVNGIDVIIDKYRNTIWNDCHCRSVIDILYRESDDIDTLESWLHDHHLIYRKRLVSDKNAKAFEKIKTPFVRRTNSQSIYNPGGLDACDFEEEEFDVMESDIKLLNKICGKNNRTSPEI